MDIELLGRLRKVKVLALDCDGVMTPLYIDTGVIMDLDNAAKVHGREFQQVVEIARFNHRDGQGIDLIKEAGIYVVVVTKQRSGYIDARCLKLGIPCVKTPDKLTGLTAWLSSEHPDVNMDEVCYVGDDLGDLSILRAVGVPVTVADAIAEARALSVYVSNKNGGDGAVREVCDLILMART